MPVIREDNHPLLFHPSVAKAIGVHEAILFQIINQQMGYAKDFIEDPMQKGDFYRGVDDTIWVYFPYAKLKEKMLWVSESSLKRMVKAMREKGVLLSAKLDSHKGDSSNWYSLDYERMGNLI
jgi:hypothetical protein